VTRASIVLLTVLLTGSALGTDLQPLLAVYPTIHGPEVTDPAQHGLDPQEITRRLEEALRATRRFRLYERNDDVRKAVLEEQDFARSERAAGNAAEFGKLKNVAYIVQPFISSFRLAASFDEIAGLPGKYRRTDSGALGVVFKVLDTTTGEIKYQLTSEASFSRAAGVQDGQSGRPGYEAWKQLVDDVSQKGGDTIADTIWPVKVVRYEQNELFVNRGEGAGIAVGETWTVFAVGDVMVDPDTKAEIGRTEFPLGKVRVTRVTPRFAVAQPIGDLKQSPKEGDILRRN
jgi:hypothetical protein